MRFTPRLIMGYGESVGDDPDFADVKLLLHMVGTNGSVSFPDSSPSGHTVTVNGNAQISTARSVSFASSSGLFDGTGDGLTIPNSTDHALGTADFTLEGWIYIAANSTPDVEAIRSATVMCTWGASGPITGWLFGIRGDASTTGTGLVLDSWSAGNATFYRTTTSISHGVWHHVAATVDGGVRRLFLDGVELSGTTTTEAAGNTNFTNGSNTLRVGITNLGGYPAALNGNLYDLRITKGAARYTGDFTPPVAQLPDS